MAEQKIKFEDIISKDFTKGLSEMSKAIEGLNTDVKTLGESFKQMGKATSDVAGKHAKSIKDLAKETKTLTTGDKRSRDAIEAKHKAIKETSEAYKRAVQSAKDIEAAEKGVTNQAKTLSKQLSEVKKGLEQAYDEGNTKKVEELTKAGGKLIATQKQISQSLRDSAKTVGVASNSYNGLSKRLNDARIELRQIDGAVDKTSAAYKKNKTQINALETEISQLDTSLKQFDADLGQHFRNVGNYEGALSKLPGMLSKFNVGVGTSTVNMGQATSAVSGAISKMGGLASAAGPVGIGIAAVAAGAAILTSELIKLSKEANESATQVSKLFGTNLEGSRDLAASVQATANTFGKEFTEVLRAANTVSKEFGVSGAEALEIINDGFIAGADLNDDFLDKLREYPAQFDAAGFSAEAFIAIATQEVKEGIYSDKGVDAVKEFGLRIREQTVATKAALEDAFGKKFSDDVLGGISDGSKTSAEALTLISKALNDSTIPAEKLQTVIADVFGGAGEDAGLRFLQSLGDIDLELNGLIDSTNEYTQDQIELLEANNKIEKAQQDIVAAFGLTGNELSGLGTKMKAFAFGILADGINFVVGFSNSLIKLYNESTSVRASFEIFGVLLKTLFTVVKTSWTGLYTLLTQPFVTLKEILENPFDLANVGRAFKEGAKRMASPLVDGFEDIKQSFIDAKDSITISPEKPLIHLDAIMGPDVPPALQELDKQLGRVVKSIEKIQGATFNASDATKQWSKDLSDFEPKMQGAGESTKALTGFTVKAKPVFKDVANAMGNLGAQLANVTNRQGEQTEAAKIGIKIAQAASAAILVEAAALNIKGIAEQATIPFPGNIIAIASTVASVIAAGNAVKQLAVPAFAEGTEFVEGPGTGTSDSIHARLSKGERVVTAKDNNAFFPTLSAIHNGTINPDILNGFVNNYPLQDVSAPVIINDNSEVVKAIKGLPIHQTTIDEHGWNKYTIKGSTRKRFINKQTGI